MSDENLFNILKFSLSNKTVDKIYEFHLFIQEIL